MEAFYKRCQLITPAPRRAERWRCDIQSGVKIIIHSFFKLYSGVAWFIYYNCSRFRNKCPRARSAGFWLRIDPKNNPWASNLMNRNFYLIRYVKESTIKGSVISSPQLRLCFDGVWEECYVFSRADLRAIFRYVALLTRWNMIGKIIDFCTDEMSFKMKAFKCACF